MNCQQNNRCLQPTGLLSGTIIVVATTLMIVVGILFGCADGAVSTGVRHLTNPYIIEHPEDQYVARNEPATLNCKAEGRPDPVITWYRNGQVVVTANENPAVDRMLLPNGQLFFLRVVPPKPGRPASDVGTYYCNATNPETGLSVISRNATLDIAVIRDEFREPPPLTLDVALGLEAVIRCRPPRGDPEPRIRWTKDGQPLPTVGAQQSGSRSAGPTAPAINGASLGSSSGVAPSRVFVDPSTGSLHIQEVRRDDAGRYVCVAFNGAGERESSPARLNVREKPRITETPKDIVAKENSNVVFHCRASGDPEPTIIWKKAEGQIAAERSFIMADRMLRIERVQISDEGVYVCRAENSVGSQAAEARLTVQSQPAFVVTPRDRSVGVGRQVAFRCEVAGNPPPAVFWNREASEAFMFPNQNHGRFTVLDDGTMVIRSVQMEDSGDYVCQGLNVAGSAVAKVKLEVKAVDLRLPPIIIHGPQNQTLPLGGVATLLCTAVGDPPAEVYWFRNGRVLLVGRDPRCTVLEFGTLQITDLRRSDTGSYTCRASSDAGETTWHPTATLVVDLPGGSPATVFHRPPQISAFPGATSRPTASDITNTSVRLTWRQNSNAGASTVIGYSIESFSTQVDDQVWTLVSEFIPDPPFVVRGLRPGTEYVFLVRARNSHGFGTPSPVSQPITTRGEAPPRPSASSIPASADASVAADRLSGVAVGLPTVDAINSTSLRVAWQLLSTSPSSSSPRHQANAVEGYRLRYRLLDATTSSGAVSPDEYMMKIVRPGDVSQFVISGLQPFSWYEVYVQPFHRTQEGPASVVARARTDEDVPTLAPSGVFATMIDNSTMRLSWKHPPPQSVNGLLLGYWVYIYDNATRFSKDIQVNGSVESIVVYHLPKAVRLTVQLAAYNVIGKGAKSDPIHAVDQLPSAVKRNMVDEPWFLVVLIAIVSGILSVLSCIVVIVLYRKYSAARRKKLSPKQADIIMTAGTYKQEDKRTAQWLSESARLSGPQMMSSTGGQLTANHAAPAVGQPMSYPRCYSNDSRASDGESRNSYQGSGLRSNNGNSHLYYTLESGAADSNADDAPNDYAVDDKLLQRTTLGGTTLPHTPPGLLRPIPQTYMIRQTTAPEYSNLDVTAGRRREPPTRQPVLFLPPPPNHLPCEDEKSASGMTSQMNGVSSSFRGVGTAGGPSHPPNSAGTVTSHQTGGIPAASRYRSSDHPQSHRPLPPTSSQWCKPRGVYDDCSEIDDTCAATWNSGTDVDDEPSHRGGSPTTDYDGTSSDGFDVDSGGVFYGDSTVTGCHDNSTDDYKRPTYSTFPDDGCHYSRIPPTVSHGGFATTTSGLQSRDAPAAVGV